MRWKKLFLPEDRSALRELKARPPGYFVNSALPAPHIVVHPLFAAMGAEITGLYPGDPSHDELDEIRAAFWHY